MKFEYAGPVYLYAKRKVVDTSKGAITAKLLGYDDISGDMGYNDFRYRNVLFEHVCDNEDVFKTNCYKLNYDLVEIKAVINELRQDGNLYEYNNIFKVLTRIFQENFNTKARIIGITTDDYKKADYEFVHMEYAKKRKKFLVITNEFEFIPTNNYTEPAIVSSGKLSMFNNLLSERLERTLADYCEIDDYSPRANYDGEHVIVPVSFNRKFIDEFNQLINKHVIQILNELNGGDFIKKCEGNSVNMDKLVRTMTAKLTNGYTRALELEINV